MCDRNKQSAMTGVDVNNLIGKCRKSEVCMKRNLCMACQRNDGRTFEEIGEMFNRHHSTVIHSIDLVNKMLSVKDPYLRTILSKHKFFNS